MPNPSLPKVDDDAIRRAAMHLRHRGLVAFPTETVYGLGADATDPHAIKRVFDLKGRPHNNPMIVHVTDREMAEGVVDQWPERASELAAQFWPGPLTLVLEKSPTLPDLVTAGQRTVGVRCPDHPIALALIREFGGPIVGPSANPSGRISPTTAQHVHDGFPDTPDLIVLDGGPCRAGIESTVLSLIHDPPQILRPGAVSREDLGFSVNAATPQDQLDQDAPLISPGTMPSHYAPAAPARLFDPRQWPAILENAPPNTIVLTHSQGRTTTKPDARFIYLPETAPAYAAALYAALRNADALAPDLILIERPGDEGGLWTAIVDRLERAAADRG